MSDPNNGNGGGRTLGGGDGDSIPSSWANRPSSGSGPRIGRIGNWGGDSSSSARSSGPRFATLNDLNSSGGGMPVGGGSHGHSHSSDEDDDEDMDGPSEADGESWFTGGERSGLSVQNPDRAVPGGDLVRNLLRKAAQAGPPQLTQESSSSRGIFSGGGHVLGGEDRDSEYIPDPTAPSAPASRPTEERAIRHLTFWRDGFSIEDGPLLRYDDPENDATLKAIDQGQAPPHLLNVRYGQPVELRVARRTDEDYKPPPKRPMRAFEGGGFRLGGVVPDITDAGSSTSMPGAFPPPSGSGAESSSGGAGPSTEPPSMTTKFEVDQTKPTTSVQIRLADGTRMVARMNLTHTVGDLRNFINASRPENLVTPYTIGTTFPNRTLDDDSQTIEEAKLANSVIVQRWA